MAERGADTILLHPGALEGRVVGLSVSESPDLSRLGLLETHLRLALGELARSVLLAGGKLMYGGHLDPHGYTMFLLHEVRRYGRRDRPLLVCLPWTEHREVPLNDLREAEKNLGLFGSITYLGPDGEEVDPARERPREGPAHGEDDADALTNLRRHMISKSDARVLAGGRRDGYEGRMPGVLEESILALEAGQPVYFAGGFGGVTSDAARTLGLDPGDWIPTSRSEEHEPIAEDLRRLGEAARGSGWSPGSNGLTEEENARLAASHRPSDIASLVTLGLGRLASRE